MKVLIVFKNPRADSPTASHQGLGITAVNAAMALREMRIDATASAIAGGEYLWARLNTDWHAATHVVFCAPFIDAGFLRKMFSNFRGVQFSLCYHSNLGFLTQDRFAVANIKPYLDLEDLHNFRLASSSIELSGAMEAATGRPFVYLPNLFHLPYRVRRTREAWSRGMDLNVGLFGAARVLKNWLTAAVGAMIISRNLDADLKLHISSNRDETAANTRENLVDLVAMNRRVQVVDVPWLDNDDFRRYLYGMDLLLQPSFSETFNNVTAEGCACGVPSVVSDAISWVPRNWVAKADSAVSVAQVGAALVRDQNAAEAGWRALDAYNTEAQEVWRKWLATGVK